MRRLPSTGRSGDWLSKKSADAFEQLPPCIVGMEACLSAHFVSRVLRALGHTPRIIPAVYTKPFVKGQKNDYNDAEAVAEAALRPNLRVVREKSQEQLDLQACHRVSLAIGLPSDGDDQPDPCLSDRAGHRCQGWPAGPAQVALRHPGEPQGRDIPSHDLPDPRALRRLVSFGRAHLKHSGGDRVCERLRLSIDVSVGEPRQQKRAALQTAGYRTSDGTELVRDSVIMAAREPPDRGGPALHRPARTLTHCPISQPRG